MVFHYYLRKAQQVKYWYEILFLTLEWRTSLYRQVHLLELRNNYHESFSQIYIKPLGLISLRIEDGLRLFQRYMYMWDLLDCVDTMHDTFWGLLISPQKVVLYQKKNMGLKTRGRTRFRLSVDFSFRLIMYNFTQFSEGAYALRKHLKRQFLSQSL